MISGTPPTGVAIIGSPAAAASRTEFGKPSANEGKTNRSPQDRISGTSLLGPRKRKCSCSPSSRTRRSNHGRSKPSPTNANRASGMAVQTVRAASIKMACPFTSLFMFATLMMSFALGLSAGNNLCRSQRALANTSKSTPLCKSWTCWGGIRKSVNRSCLTASALTITYVARR